MIEAAAPPAIRIIWDSASVPEWIALLRTVPASTLTQSFGYNAAMMLTDRWTPRLGIIELADHPIGLVVMVERKSGLGLRRLIRLHRGPLIRPEAAKPAVVASVLKAIRTAYPGGWRQDVVLAPELPEGEQTAGMLRWAGFKPVPGPPYRTIWLDLTLPEPDLRAGLHPKWRNALVKAERSGLTVEVDAPGASLDWLMPHYLADCQAKGFAGPSPVLLHRLRAALRKDGDFLILRALQGKEPVAAILIPGHGLAATYQIGWTGEAGRRTNAHNLLLWQAVRLLKQQGRQRLDLGGLLPDRAPGVTAFKRGLGGQEVALTGLWR
jgi:hypothetical protein